MRSSLVVGLSLSFFLGSTVLIQQKFFHAESQSLPTDSSLARYEIPDPFQQATPELNSSSLSETVLVEAEAFWRRKILLDSSDGVAHYQLANVLLSQGDHQAAEAAYRKAIEHGSDNAIAYKNLGMLLALRGEASDERLDLLREAARLAPDDAETVAILARELQYQGEYDESADAAARAIQIDSNNDQLYLQLYLLRGESLAAQKKYNAAAAAYREAIRLAPENEEARRSLAEVLYRDGQVEAAIAADRKVNYYIGDTYRIYEQYSAAAVNYREAVRLNPDFAEAYIKLAVTLHDLGKTDEAETVYDQAIQMVERDPQPGRPFVQYLYDSYSLLLKEQGRESEAEAIQARSPIAQP